MLGVCVCVVSVCGGDSVYVCGVYMHMCGSVFVCVWSVCVVYICMNVCMYVCVCVYVVCMCVLFVCSICGVCVWYGGRTCASEQVHKCLYIL